MAAGTQSNQTQTMGLRRTLDRLQKHQRIVETAIAIQASAEGLGDLDDVIGGDDFGGFGGGGGGGTATKRRRGRPKGSGSKTTSKSARKASGATKTGRKRGPGRPKGSKNKPKDGNGGGDSGSASES